MALQEQLNNQGKYLFRNRSYLPLVVLIIGLFVYIERELNEVETTEHWLMEEFEFICLATSLLGLLIRVVTVGYTPKLTSGRNTRDGQIAESLNTTGMYSAVRHPLYLGNLFMWLGVAMLTENVWFIIAFILFFAFYYERIMYMEETFLRTKFGREYLDWASATPTFIPSLKNYKAPSHSFSWKKVLRNEKNGLAAIFLLFWLFEFIGESANGQKPVIELDFWFYAAVTATIIYLVLKVLKKRKFLDEIGR